MRTLLTRALLFSDKARLQTPYLVLSVGKASQQQNPFSNAIIGHCTSPSIVLLARLSRSSILLIAPSYLLLTSSPDSAQFETPLPPLQPAVFPPALHEPPPPALELFDLDEAFAGQAVRLATLTNKVRTSDLYLSSFVRFPSSETKGVFKGAQDNCV
jgi:hypothetical protein